jgi:hypothetical protein
MTPDDLEPVEELFTPDGIWEWPDGERRTEVRQALRRSYLTTYRVDS